MRSRLLLLMLLMPLAGCGWEMYRKHPGDHHKGDWRSPHLKLIYLECEEEKATDISLCVAAKVNPWANIKYERAQ